MIQKIQKLILGGLAVLVLAPLLWAEPARIPQPPLDSFSEEPRPGEIQQGPSSLEPALERDGVRISLRTAFNKKNTMTVFVKISNLSDHPVLVSPDAVEVSTEGGFIIRPLGANQKTAQSSSPSSSTWSTLSKAAALIPFSTPYRIVYSAKSIAQFSGKTWSNVQKQIAPVKQNSRSLLEVILQPGMGTHGSLVYDASFIKAYSRPPAIHIQVKVDGGEPFEFRFAGR